MNDIEATELVEVLAFSDIEGKVEDTGGGLLIVFVQLTERWSIGIDGETIVLYDGPRGTGDNERVLYEIPEYWSEHDVATFVWTARTMLTLDD